ncbi:MAG: DUF2235 domain-containing protein [Solirubrobacteraceae bacterium]
MLRDSQSRYRRLLRHQWCVLDPDGPADVGWDPVKRLLLLCDGTWDRATRKSPTNVRKLSDALADTGTAPDGSPIAQLSTYVEGVGTSFFDRLPGGIFGVGISAKIKAGYRWICQNYEPGDELFLFGFSRGAFTARSCAGLIRNAGILRPGQDGLVDDAYRLYRSRDAATHPDGETAKRFRAEHSLDPVPIRFIGVWDTVGALGIPGVPARMARGWWGFHDLNLSSRVDLAFQALSIDEHRRPYRPTPWEHQPHSTNQTLCQVWFTGTHGDVGGGYHDPSLSEIALMWMVGRASERAGLGIRPDYFHELAAAPLDPARELGLVISPTREGHITNTRKGIFKLLPAYLRPMIDPTGMARYWASSTATARLNISRLRYDAPNLKEYLHAGGSVQDVDIG